MPTVIFYDDFTGALSSDISGRSPDNTGTNWQKNIVFTGATSPAIGTDGISATNAVGSYGTAVQYKANCGFPIPQTNVEIEWQLGAAPFYVGMNEEAIGCWFRANGSGDSARMGFFAKGGGNYYLQYNNFTIQVSSGIVVPSAGDIVKINITGPDAFTVKVNGITIITWQTGIFIGPAMGAFSDVFIFAGESDYSASSGVYYPGGTFRYFKITDTITSTANLSSQAFLTASALSVQFGNASLTSATTLTGDGSISRNAEASLTSVATLTADALVVHDNFQYVGSGELVLGSSSQSAIGGFGATATINSALSGQALVSIGTTISVAPSTSLTLGGSFGVFVPYTETAYRYIVKRPHFIGHDFNGRDYFVSLYLEGSAITNRYGYTWNGGLVLSGDIDVTYIPTGGLILGGETTDSDVKIVYYSDFDFEWNISSTIEIDIDFAWDVGKQVLHYYQVEGTCEKPPNCETTGIETNDDKCSSGGARFTQIIAARSTSDLCTKLQQRFLNYPVRWPIQSIKRYSRPVYTTDIDREEANGIDHSCNKKEEIIFCHVPECFDLCAGLTYTAEIGISVFCQDLFLTYTGSGGLTLDGRQILNVNQDTTPHGGLTLSGNNRIKSNRWKYAMKNGLIIDIDASVKSSAWKYEGSGDLSLSGRVQTNASAYRYRTNNYGLSIFGTNSSRYALKSKPKFKFKMSGTPKIKNNLIFGDISQVELKLSGTNNFKSDRHQAEFIGGVELGGSPKLVMSHWKAEFTSGLNISGIAKLKYRTQFSGGMSLSGSFENKFKLHYSPNIHSVLSGSAIIPASSAWSWTAVGGVVLSGVADDNYKNFGDLIIDVESIAELVSNNNDLIVPNYPVVGNLPAIVAPTDTVNAFCGCDPMPLTLKFFSNINSTNILKEFLIRNKLTLSKQQNLIYNKFDNTWRSMVHLQGIGQDVDKKWTIVFEWGCTDEVGHISLWKTVWKLSVLIRRVSNIGKTETRILYTFPIEKVCTNNAINYEFVIDTNTGEVLDLPDYFEIATTILDDEIGLFKGTWEKNPNLEFKITEFGSKKDVPVKDIKPIFSKIGVVV